MPAIGNHILIVSDNQEIPDMISRTPGRNTLKVSTQGRLSDFIHEVKEMQPDFISMDKTFFTFLSLFSVGFLCRPICCYNEKR
jgi:hypothetical protein